MQINLNLTERKSRTISGAVGYSTDFGVEGDLAWEHRNVFGEGERLALALSVNEVNQSLTADLRSPDFLRGDQTLVIHSGVTASNTDAFQSKEFDNSAVVERRLTDDLTVGAGLRYRLVAIKEENTEDVFGLFSIPAFLEWDYSDDLLDPSKGGRFRFALEPFVDTLGGDANFLRYEASYSHYFELAARKKVILALRAAAGRIEWTQRSEIPKDELFYSGGGGSVRGYSFQTAGPLDERNNPAGGLAKLEFSGEIRYRLSESFGLTAFLDAGRAYGDKTPEFDEDLFYGGGLGFSYYTSIGPIRIDLATPLNKRPGIDDDFQVYISIGQAF
jgi:translocation and assembly module TamA